MVTGDYATLYAVRKTVSSATKGCEIKIQFEDNKFAINL